MKKLLLYLMLAVVSLLSAVPRVVHAQPYNCTDCMRPFDILNSLYFLTNGGYETWVYTEDPLYPLSDNNQTAWDATTWDVSNSIPKPSWSGISLAYWNDTGYDGLMMKDLSVTYGPLKEAVAAAELDILSLAGDMAVLESSTSGKMDIPSGTTSQYVRGDGSLASFPSLSTVATSGAYDDLSGKPSLGTSAALNVAAAGNAASGEVVKGSDTRLTDSRTPTAHTHATADVTSGTFADARIAQSNVTQHQAALSIGSSQVTGTKTSAYISDFAEAAQDNVLGVVTAGNGLSYTYNDAGNAASISLASKTYQTPTFNSATTATRLSTTVEADVFYSFDATVTISLIAGQSVTAVLKYADDSGMSSNVVTVDSAKTANSGVLNLTQTNTLRVGGKIPAGKYRQVTFVTAGSGVAAPSAIAAGQEVF